MKLVVSNSRQVTGPSKVDAGAAPSFESGKSGKRRPSDFFDDVLNHLVTANSDRLSAAAKSWTQLFRFNDDFGAPAYNSPEARAKYLASRGSVGVSTVGMFVNDVVTFRRYVRELVPASLSGTVVNIKAITSIQKALSSWSSFEIEGTPIGIHEDWPLLQVALECGVNPQKTGYLFRLTDNVVTTYIGELQDAIIPSGSPLIFGAERSHPFSLLLEWAKRALPALAWDQQSRGGLQVQVYTKLVDERQRNRRESDTLTPQNSQNQHFATISTIPATECLATREVLRLPHVSFLAIDPELKHHRDRDRTSAYLVIVHFNPLNGLICRVDISCYRFLPLLWAWKDLFFSLAILLGIELPSYIMVRILDFASVELLNNPTPAKIAQAMEKIANFLNKMPDQSLINAADLNARLPADLRSLLGTIAALGGMNTCPEMFVLPKEAARMLGLRDTTVFAAIKSNRINARELADGRKVLNYKDARDLWPPGSKRPRGRPRKTQSK